MVALHLEFRRCPLPLDVHFMMVCIMGVGLALYLGIPMHVHFMWDGLALHVHLMGMWLNVSLLVLPH